MIYGCLTFSSKVLTLVDDFKQVLNWSTAISKELKFQNFSGAMLQDSRLPNNLDSRYVMDEKSETLLLFSGNIYNQKELEDSNIAKASTAQFLLDRYQKMGLDFVQDLNGDFAIFIYEAASKKILLFRDHVGIQPLSYVFEEEVFSFSSDTLNLCKIVHHPDEKINLEALLDGIKVVDYSQTPNPKVKKLLPGHYLIFEEDKISIHRYWFPEQQKENRHYTKTEVMVQLEKLLKRAVEIRCDPQLKVATHVSGGLDSGLVSALVRENYPDQEPFLGFSWSPEILDAQGMEFDERIRVNETCDYLKITPVFIAGEATNWINHKNNYFPNTSSFEEDFVLDYANKNGIQILFSGWGGDDFVSIGNNGVLSDLFFQGKILKLWNNKQQSTLRRKIAVIFYKIIYPAMGLRKKNINRQLKANTTYLKKGFKDQDLNPIKQIYQYASRMQKQINSLNDGHLALRTEAWFHNGIRNGIIYRYPLLDKDLIEFMFTVPSVLLYDESIDRKIFREICKHYLPKNVCDHERKTDPILNKFSEEYYEQSCIKIMKNISILKQNEALDCFDFELIEKDYAHYVLNAAQKNNTESLFCTIFNLDMIDQFTKQYRNKNVEIPTKP